MALNAHSDRKTYTLPPINLHRNNETETQRDDNVETRKNKGKRKFMKMK